MLNVYEMKKTIIVVFISILKHYVNRQCVFSKDQGILAKWIN